MSPLLLRNIKPLSIAAGLLALLIVAGSFATNYGWINVEATGTGSQPVTITVNAPGSTAVVGSAQLTPGSSKSFFVHTGTLEVSATQGKRISLSSGIVQGLQTKKVSLALHDEGSLSKVATNSKGCGFSAGGTYYSYGCNGSSQIYVHSAGAPDSLRPYSGRLYDKLAQSQNGVVTLLTGESKKTYASFIEPATNHETTIALPAALQSQDSTDLAIVNNEQSGSTYAFAILGRTNHLWALYRSAGDTNPSLAVLNPPGSAELNRSNQLIGNTITSYFANQTAEVQPDVNSTPAQIPPGHLMTTQIIAGGSPVKTLTLTNSPSYDVKLLNATTVIAGLTSGDVRVFTVSGNKLTPQQLFTGAGGLATHNGTALFSIDKDLYKYDPASMSAHRIFSATKLSLDNLGFLDNLITLSTSITDQPGYNAYQIDPGKSATYPQPE
jgi:hypothetical protein